MEINNIRYEKVGMSCDVYVIHDVIKCPVIHSKVQMMMSE